MRQVRLFIGAVLCLSAAAMLGFAFGNVIIRTISGYALGQMLSFMTHPLAWQLVLMPVVLATGVACLAKKPWLAVAGLALTLFGAFIASYAMLLLLALSR